MTERLVIQTLEGLTPGATMRRFISRARLTPNGRSHEPTQIGTAIYTATATIDGANPQPPHGHSLTVDLVHDALWSWGEVEPAVVAAFAMVLGDDVEVIREDKRPATPAPVVPQ